MSRKSARKRKSRRRNTAIPLAGGEVAFMKTRVGQGAAPDAGPPPIYAARQRRCDLDGKSVLHESDMGRCIIAASVGQEREDLAEAWAVLSAARRTYRIRIIGVSGEPQGAAVAMLPDRLQSDASLRVDLRTEAERDAAARRVWGEWEARIKRLPTPQHIWAIRGALDGFLGEGRLWQDAAPTSTGLTAVAALRAMAAVRA